MKHHDSFARSAVLLPSMLFTLLFGLSACAKTDLAGDKTKADNVATVNGKAISKEMFDIYVEAVTQGQGKTLNDVQRQQVIDQLIGMQLVAERAEKQGVSKDKTLEAQLQLSRMQVLMTSLLKAHIDEHPITEAEIKAEYDTYVASLGREYRARHVLVESKAAADAVIEKLKAGADFAKLAEKESIDGSAKQGGDLNWFSLSTMVKPFADAVATLEKGKFTQAPVQSQFGWHVIKLEDMRTATPQPFDEIKDQVKNAVQRKKVQAFVEDLRKTAKIEKPSTPAEQPAAGATPEKK